MIKDNHVEISDNTKIVSSINCPLKGDEVSNAQIFNNHIICICEGQGADFICPYFYGAVYPNKKGDLFVDCKR